MRAAMIRRHSAHADERRAGFFHALQRDVRSGKARRIRINGSRFRFIGCFTLQRFQLPPRPAAPREGSAFRGVDMDDPCTE
jgi:hypothetical protein